MEQTEMPLLSFDRLANIARVKDIMEPVEAGPTLYYDDIVKNPSQIIYKLCDFNSYDDEYTDNEYYNDCTIHAVLGDDVNDNFDAKKIETQAENGHDILQSMVDHLNDRGGQVYCDSKREETKFYHLLCPVAERHRTVGADGNKVSEQRIGYLWMRGYLDQDLSGSFKHRRETLEKYVNDNIMPADCLTSGEVTAVDFLEFIADEKQFFVVIEGPKPIGLISYRQFLGPTFRLVILATIFDLEECSLRLILRQPQNPWSFLSDTDKERSRKIYGGKFQREVQDEEDPDTIGKLLACTMFAQKEYLIRKMKLLPRKSNSAIEKFFKTAEKVRNACAHTGADDHLERLLPGPKSLHEFLNESKDFVDTMSESMPLEVDSWIYRSRVEAMRRAREARVARVTLS